MKLEDQVCTLEQAKKLKELGVSIDTYATWYQNREFPDMIELDCCSNPNETSCLSVTMYDEYPAPSVAELGVLLPKDIYVGGVLLGSGELKCHYELKEKHFETEAQERTDRLIWYVEKGYIQAKDLKL